MLFVGCDPQQPFVDFMLIQLNYAEVTHQQRYDVT